MSENAVVLLQGLLEKSRDQSRGQLSDIDHQTYWTAEQYLKSLGTSPEELIGGIVDGEKDCGVDAAYIFVNGFCISDDSVLPPFGRNARLELVLLQVKNSSGFGEAAIDKLIVNLPRILQFQRDEAELASFANPRLIEVTRRFLDTYAGLDLPDLSIYTAFASLKAAGVHANTVEKADELAKACANIFPGCAVHSAFLDAATLYEMARESRSTLHSLQLSENPISTDTAGGYIGVVRLADYQRFITNENGELDSNLFEANVRDYEGDTPVNQSIEQTLETVDTNVDFWWLNNGVTIVATKVQLANKMMQLEGPQIVNGLQTSNEIYKRSRHEPVPESDPRSVLVKVIEAKEPSIRDRIIRATNSQTSFGPSALRATDKVQRHIEDYLAGHDLYYERRRRQYYNLGKPMDRIISIDGMGQALVSVLLQRPHLARAKPRQIFDPDVYDVIFTLDHPIGMYAAAIQLQRQCDAYLQQLRRSDIADFRNHLATVAAMLTTRKMRPTAADLSALEDVAIDRDTLVTAYQEIGGQYDIENRKSGGAALLDQLAKSEKVTEAILERARKLLRTTAAPRS